MSAPTLKPEIRALGYVGVHAKSVEDWVAYGTGLLGLQVADRSRSRASFRMDERKQRLIVTEKETGGAAFFGWEVADAAGLNKLGARLEKHGVAVQRLTRVVADERGVTELIQFSDPIGNRLEAFHGAAATGDPFTPGRTISGFVTGALGMGHVVLTAERIEPVISFYRDVLGFRPSDYILRPFKAYFFHVNPRHHSFAVIETGRDGLHHLMLELNGLDDVGQGYDLALGNPERIATTLGRHTNDFMTSFYVRTPSDFFIEYGWGGRCIDVASWQAFEMTDGPSLWGHDRAWLPEEQRAAARRLRLSVAEAGVRQPVQVRPGNHALSPDHGES